MFKVQRVGKDVYKEIWNKALAIRRVALYQQGNTILRKMDPLVGLLAAKHLGFDSITQQAEYAGISRKTLAALLQDAKAGKSEAHKLFLIEWNQI